MIYGIAEFCILIPPQITESLDLNSEDLGLAGIKFLLDEGGDIIFLNDLFSLQVVSISDESQTSPTIWSSKSMMEDDKSKLSTGNESADILFCCETFEVLALDSNGAALLFRSFTGHHIEFRTNTIKPIEKMSLKCEGSCACCWHFHTFASHTFSLFVFQ